MAFPKEWTLDELKRAMSSFGDAYQGASEGITSMATGLAASVPAGWQALTAAMGGASPEEATRRFEETQQGLTYEPRTPEGQGFVRSVASRFEPLNTIAQWSGGKAADAVQRIPVVGEHLAPAAGAAVDTAVQFAPAELAMGGANALRGGARAAASNPAVQSFLNRALAEPQRGVVAPPFEWWKAAQVDQEPHPVRLPRAAGPTPSLEQPTRDALFRNPQALTQNPPPLLKGPAVAAEVAKMEDAVRPASGGGQPPPAAPGLPELKLPPELMEEPVVVGPPRPEATGAQPGAPAGIQQAPPVRDRKAWMQNRMDDIRAGEQAGSATNLLPVWQKAAYGEAAEKAKKGGFTMRMIGRDPKIYGSGPFPERGFAFVPEQGHEQILSHAPAPREIAKFVEDHQGTLERDWGNMGRGAAVPVVGDWESGGGRHHMEVGRVAPHNPGDTDAMLQLAGKADQRAVYDLGAGREIPVPDEYRPQPQELPPPKVFETYQEEPSVHGAAPEPYQPGGYRVDYPGVARFPEGELVKIRDLQPGEGIRRPNNRNVYRKLEGNRVRLEERKGGPFNHGGGRGALKEGSSTAMRQEIGAATGEYLPPKGGDKGQAAWGGGEFEPNQWRKPDLEEDAKGIIRRQGGNVNPREARHANKALANRDALEAAAEQRMRQLEAGNEVEPYERRKDMGDLFLHPEWHMPSDVGEQGSFRAPLDIKKAEEGGFGVPDAKDRAAFRARLRAPDPDDLVAEANMGIRGAGGKEDPSAAYRVNNALERRDRAMEASHNEAAPGQKDFFLHPEWEMPSLPGKQGIFRARPEGWAGAPRPERATFNLHARNPNAPNLNQLKDIIRQQGGRVRQEAARNVFDALERRDMMLNPEPEVREYAVGPNKDVIAEREVIPHLPTDPDQGDLGFLLEMKRDFARNRLEGGRVRQEEMWNANPASKALDPDLPPDEEGNIAFARANRGAVEKPPKDYHSWKADQLDFGNEPGWENNFRDPDKETAGAKAVRERELARPEEERKRLYEMLRSGDDAEWDELARDQGGPSLHNYAGRGHAKNSEGNVVGSSIYGPVKQDAVAALERFKRKFGFSAEHVKKVEEDFDPTKSAGDVRRMLKEDKLRRQGISQEPVPRYPVPKLEELTKDQRLNMAPKLYSDDFWRTKMKDFIEQFPTVEEGKPLPNTVGKALDPREMGLDPNDPKSAALVQAWEKAMGQREGLFASTAMRNNADYRYPAGQVRWFGSNRHANVPTEHGWRVEDKGGWRGAPGGWEMGFVDYNGKFMTRTEAEAYAQSKLKKGQGVGRITSEMLEKLGLLKRVSDDPKLLEQLEAARAAHDAKAVAEAEAKLKAAREEAARWAEVERGSGPRYKSIWEAQMEERWNRPSVKARMAEERAKRMEELKGRPPVEADPAEQEALAEHFRKIEEDRKQRELEDELRRWTPGSEGLPDKWLAAKGWETGKPKGAQEYLMERPEDTWQGLQSEIRRVVAEGKAAERKPKKRKAK